MFGNKRFQNNGVRVTKDDIKKAIKAANDRLKKANDKLEQGIVDKKKSLGSIEKEISSNENELKSALSAIEGAKKDAIRANTEVAKERIKEQTIQLTLGL